jgi:RHS repeat-associated protein
MRYRCLRVNDPGVNGGAEPGRNLYLKQITYTGENGAEGRYAVTFIRDRELGEALRADKIIDARGGFKRVTGDLLRRADVTFDHKLVRRYEFKYTTGAFFKTLLKSVSQFDEHGVLFNSHRFDYYDDIRDSGGNYHAFAPANWTSPGDGLSEGVLNLTPNQAGNASAVNANTSVGGGGHLYVGVGTVSGKSNSIGVKVGFSHNDDRGVLALVDVDGDGLPDKVFNDGGAVKYRKNLSGPTGALRFSDQAIPLSLPGLSGEDSNSLTLGIEAYFSGVAAQLDYVNAFSTTNQYFSDVNGDGIADLVNGSSVLFGRIGLNGVPVYGISADTPVPVGSGHVDTNGLFGGFTADRQRLGDSFPLLDTVRRWVAPFDGVVKVEGAVKLADATAVARAASTTADGVRAAIQHNATELWSQRIGVHDNTAHLPTGVNAVAVTRGDRLYFRVGSVDDGSLDEVSWDPKVTYQSVPNALDVNGLSVYGYQASRDFTLGGRSADVKVPLTGTLHVTGDLHKLGNTTDDVTALITRNGTPVLKQTLAAGAVGSIPMNLDVPVQKGQTLSWRIGVDSPIDVDQLEWTPHAFYTAANGVDRLTDAGGNPLIEVDPPYQLDLYPVDGLTAPQGFYHAPRNERVTVSPRLSFNFGSAQPTAQVTFTVKRRGELLAKRFFDIQQGHVTSPASFTVQATAGDDLFFDFSTLDPKLRAFLTDQSVQVSIAGGAATAVPSAFHSAAEEDAFPQPYRGWGPVGYNGNKVRATHPIVEGDLVVDKHFGDQLPSSVDPQAQKAAFAADPRVDPPKVVPFIPSPAHQRWEISEHSFAARDSLSSSRTGADSVDLPKPSDFAGGSAVPRLSRSDQISLTGGIGGGIGNLGGSISAGDSTGQVDFLDMNGDGFPDVLGAGGIQYTDSDGALGTTHGPMPDGAIRESSNVAGNASAGSAARTISTGRGYAAPSGRATANTADAGNDMPPFGVGGTLGGSKSDSQFDLLDINGDRLPDRVYSDGRAALNLGYGFGRPEHWRNPAALNDGSGSTFGLNIGFNTDFYGFAGGASYNQGSRSTAATLADMNGDGLLDRVFVGHPIKVALNTGSGFEPAVPFNGSLASIDGDRSATLGGGAYFTFSICFIAVCVIINPGGDITTGASRSEQALHDINGDGYTDQLFSTRDDQLVVAENRTGRTNLLRAVTRPLGARMTFDYTRDGNTYNQPQSRWVLSRVAVDDGQRGDGQDVQLVTYEYQNGVYDRLEREFYGYATVIEQQRDHGAGDAIYRSIARDYATDSYYTRGLPLRELTEDGGGRPFLETQYSYQLRDIANAGGSADPKSTTATIFPELIRTDRRFYEGQPTPRKSTFTTMEYDAYGNMTRSFDAADAGPGDDVDVRIRYTADAPSCGTSYIVGTPNLIDVFGGGTLMRHRESTVDCVTGNVTRVRAKLANGGTAVTDLSYYGNGNVKSVVGPLNERGERYRLVYTYDTVVDAYVVAIADSFGYRSTSTYNFKFGQVETTTDFNKQVVRNTYDSVGRLRTVTGPYEAAEHRVTIDLEYRPLAAVPYAVTRHVDREADGTVRPDTIDTITFVDGLKRPIQTKKDATLFTGPNTAPQNGMIVSGRVKYDFLGRPVEQFYPVTEPKSARNTTFNPAFDTVQPTRISYDVLDRTTKTVLPDNTASTITYGFGRDRAGQLQFETVATDANGKSKRTYQDVRRLATAIKEFNLAGGKPVIWTSYGYDPLGELTSVVDDQHNTTTAAYDNFGRRVVIDSPDSGRTETVYDLAGNQIRKITAKLAAQHLAIRYDYSFNRLAAIRYPVFTANNVTYTYGGPGAPHNSADRITRITDGAGTLVREYGPLGEVTKETRTSSAQGSHVRTFTTQYRYDTWNRMLRMTYPDGEVLSYHYNAGGLVDAATGVKGRFSYHYLRRLEYDKFEQRALLDTGNGTRTRYTYNPADRRLHNIRANLSQGYVFQNLNYTYDRVGNVTSIRNDTVAPSSPNVGMQVGGPSTQTFRYDDLYQLTHAEGTYQPRTPRTDEYVLDLTYDSIHNITRKDQEHHLISNGQAIVDRKLSYDYAYKYSGRSPHEATSLGIYTIAYDANGNQISRDQKPRPRRQMIWDEENRLACSHENVQKHALPQTPASCDNAGGTPNDARYFYDDQGNRIVKDSAQFHFYPNQNYSTDGNKSFKHVYIGATKLITKLVEPAQRYEDRQFYSQGDQLGSTAFVTDSKGGLAEHLQYFPGGETWVSEHPSQPVPQQYTGKELDPETNLYYYGTRYYDPRTQQWQTPDPALDTYLDGRANGGVYHSPNLALYSYSYNNPVRLIDPDGQFPWNRVAGAAKLLGGIAEAGTGIALGAATSWTGVGAVGGAFVAAHGTDVAISGFRQLISGEDTSSLTSQGLQAAGVSKSKADVIDSGVSFVGSVGAGFAASAIKSAARAAARVAAEDAASEASRLASRVDELHGVLDPIAQNSRTTAVMSTEEGADILASGGRDLSPAQRALAKEGDILARSPGAHAEITALEAAEKAGFTPSELAVSRPICSACEAAIEESGGVINDDLLGAYWP